MTGKTEDIWWEEKEYDEYGKKIDEVLGGLSEFEKAEEILKYMAKQGDGLDSTVAIVQGRLNYEVIMAILAMAEKDGVDRESAMLNVGFILTNQAHDMMKKHYPSEAVGVEYGRRSLRDLEMKRNDGYRITEE